jgi:hypothetical protein
MDIIKATGLVIALLPFPNSISIVSAKQPTNTHHDSSDIKRSGFIGVWLNYRGLEL